MSESEWNLPELMVCATSREIKNGERVFVGIGVPLLAATLAKLTHAPNIKLIYEAGGFDAQTLRLPWGIDDNPTTEKALMATTMWRIFSDQQKGFVDLGILGGAQIDRYGNLNTSAIFGKGDYFQPSVTLPGSGGGNDIASSARRTIILMRLEKRRFVKKVDYITSPGYLNGFNSRKKVGLIGGGPSAVITSKAIFRFDEKTKEMYLDSVAPGVSVEEVKSEVQWNLKVAKSVKVIEPPTREELEIIRLLDPAGIVLSPKEVNTPEDFNSFITLLRKNIEKIKKKLY